MEAYAEKYEEDMKISEAMILLAKLFAEYGDIEVMTNYCYGTDYEASDEVRIFFKKGKTHIVAE